MPKHSGLIWVLIFCSIMADAQPKLGIAEVDSISWELYQAGKWKELISFSEEAGSWSMDFYYLQVRTGIACYNLGKYRKASDWFLRTWENDKPEWLQEYLYYSLLFGGRQLEAEKHAGSFSKTVNEKIGFHPRKLTRLAFEAGYSFNGDFAELKAAGHGTIADVGGDYGEAYYFRNYHFQAVDLIHRMSPGFNIAHNFTYLGMNREQIVDWGGQNSFPVCINQYQYFFNPYFIVGKKLYLSPSATFIWGNYDISRGYIDASGRSFYSSKIKYTDVVFSASLWSHFGLLAPGAEFNFADISSNRFMQTSFWITVYPLSDVNLYFIPQAYFKSTGGNGLNFIAGGISGGVQLGKMHLNTQYLAGEMEHFIESGGYIVSNFPGISNHKFSGSLYFPAANKVQFVVRYIFRDTTERYRVYSNFIQSNSVNYHFSKHTFTAGISWNL